jgi:2-polyprenyl-3-methyl-5-hydroxy-6-metoxy-1,4-benzoquinol methylase
MSRDEKQKQVWDQLWSRKVNYDWDPLSETIYEEILALTGGLKGKRIIEAGSGTGKISRRLASEGAAVTLVDYSEQALQNSRSAFREANVTGMFVLSDIRSMGLPEERFDLTWNAGVLEHFDFAEKVTILQEMARITRPDGLILVLTPCAACLPYRIGKEVAERTGTWMYGVENPVLSLKDEFAASGLELLQETHIGFLDSLPFLDFVPQSQEMKQWLAAWYERLSEQERGMFPGYLLVSTGKRKAALPSPLDKLAQAQAILSGYHAQRSHSHYLAAYRDAEASYWQPLLHMLDELLASTDAETAVGKPTIGTRAALEETEVKQQQQSQPEHPSLAPASAKRVLDVGAAYGTLLLYSALSGAACEGLDMTDQYWSQELERDYGIGWSLCNIEAEDIPGAQQYDIILFTGILEHMIYNPLPVFEKFHRRLRLGGSVLLSTPWKRHFAPAQIYPDVEAMPFCKPGDTFIDAEIKYYTIDELVVLTEASGFNIQSLRIHNGHFIAWLVRK